MQLEKYMNKVGRDQIKKYYSKKDVVVEYDKRRFSGVGGAYINDNEIEPHLNILSELFKKPSSISVLDIGAGRGRLSAPIKKEGFKVYPLDSSPEMVKFLKKHIQPKNIIIQSAFDPIKSKTKFDVLTSLRFFDHFNISDQKKLLKNFKNKLSSKGIVLFATLNRLSLEFLVSSIFYYGKVNFYYSDQEYVTLFKSLGFEVVKREQRFFVPRGVILHTQKIPLLANLFIAIDRFLSALLPSGCAYFVYFLKRK